MEKVTSRHGIDFFKRNLRLIQYETILSSIGVGFAVSIMTVFWNSIGMNQNDIGITQMLFTIAVLIFDIPMGYVADRFNRKIVNIIGDLGTALSFLFYAFAQNMLMAVIGECLLGLFMAMTNGVDQSFIKYNSNKIDPTGKLFKIINIRTEVFRYIALFATALMGGFIAKYSLRLAIALSFAPYFVAGILAIFIKDHDVKLQQKAKNPVKDLIIAIKEMLSNKKTRVYLMAKVIGNEVTHPQIWVFTPLLILCGVPLEIVSFGWVLNFLMQIIGGKLSEKLANSKVSKMFAIPMLIEFLWMFALIIKVNIFTVWLFALNGFVHGLIRTNLTTALQESTKDEVQTSILSIASSCSRILYIFLVWFVNYLGNIKLIYALVGNCIVFVPLFIVTIVKLLRLEKNEG